VCYVSRVDHSLSLPFKVLNPKVLGVKTTMSDQRRELLKHLPKVDDVLAQPVLKQWVGSPIVLKAVRDEIQAAREALLAGGKKAPTSSAVARAARKQIESSLAPRLTRVINGTGVIIHTNLGRSPLGKKVLDAVVEAASGYSTLEYDLGRGERGSRHELVTHLLTALTGAEDALVVNNNAAAVLLALASLAGRKEVVVSRGQLVEIGGSFRIPDICKASGVKMVEVGTTNRTRISDYENAIGPRTGLLLRVHPSNFRVEGFTEEVKLADLVALGEKHGVPVVDDLGSGALMDPASRTTLPHEPLSSASIKAGAHIVTFSGDKLLGGPQAGIIVGRREQVARMRKHPLMRAVRPDKITFAALDATLRSYFSTRTVGDEVPIWKMLEVKVSELEKWGRPIESALKSVAKSSGFVVNIERSMATPGGGCLPQAELPSAALQISGPGGMLTILQSTLRQANPPVIGYLRDGVFRLDLRTMYLEDRQTVIDAVRWALERMNS